MNVRVRGWLVHWDGSKSTTAHDVEADPHLQSERDLSISGMYIQSSHDVEADPHRIRERRGA